MCRRGDVRNVRMGALVDTSKYLTMCARSSDSAQAMSQATRLFGVDILTSAICGNNHLKHNPQSALQFNLR
jgi:hypothetical protein